MAVYFARRGNEVKIGYTGASPISRVSSLQTGCPDKITLYHVLPKGTVYFETELHRKFRQYRIRGEWFSLSPDIVRFVERSKTTQRIVKEIAAEWEETYKEWHNQQKCGRYEDEGYKSWLTQKENNA